MIHQATRRRGYDGRKRISMIRKIYMVEAYTDDGKLRIRRYAANKRTVNVVICDY